MFSKTTLVTALLLTLFMLPTQAQDQSTDLNRTYVVHNLCPGPINLFIAAELQAILAPGATLKKVTDVESGFWYSDANGGRFTGVDTMRTGFSDNTYWLIKGQGQINTGLKVAPSEHPNPDGTCVVTECNSASCTDTFIDVLPIFPPNASSPAPFHHCGPAGPAANIAFDLTFCPDGKFPPNTGIQIHPFEHDDKCLEVRGAKFQNGTPVQINDCNGKQEQNWFFVRGTTTVRAAGMNFCLDAGLKPANGTGLKIAECFKNLPSQQWNFTEQTQFILEKHNQCIDLTDGVVTNGAQIETLECSESINQVWDI